MIKFNRQKINKIKASYERLNRESGANPERSRRCNREFSIILSLGKPEKAWKTRNFSQKNYPGFDSVPPAMDRIGDAFGRHFCALP